MMINMKIENLELELKEYIERFYEAPVLNEAVYIKGSVADITKDANDYIKNKEALDLDSLINNLGESFSEYLFKLIDEKRMDEVEVYKAANVDRRLISKIRSNPAYHPRKNIVLALAVAMRLDIPETVELLSHAEYALSPGNKGDLIVKFFIEHKTYDIDTINYALHEYGEPLLGSN